MTKLINLESFEAEGSADLLSLSSRLQKTANLMRARDRMVLKATADLTLTDWRILVALQNVSEVTAAQLTQETHIDKGQFSRRINALVERGFVTKAVSSGDRRRQFLKITEDGRALFDRVAPEIAEWSQALEVDLGPVETENLLAILDRVDNALQE